MGWPKRPTSALVPMNYAPGPKVDNFSLSSSNAQFHVEFFSLPKHLRRDGIQYQTIVICLRLQKIHTTFNQSKVQVASACTGRECSYILRLSFNLNFASLVKSQLTILLRFRLNSAFLPHSLKCVVQILFTAETTTETI